MLWILMCVDFIYFFVLFLYLLLQFCVSGSQEQRRGMSIQKRRETLNSPFLFKEPRRMSGGIPSFLISNCSLLLCHITVVCVLCILILTVACKHVFALLLLRYTQAIRLYPKKKNAHFFLLLLALSLLLYPHTHTHTPHHHHQVPNIITCDPILKLNLTKWNIHVFRNNTCFSLSFTNDNNKRQICCMRSGRNNKGNYLKQWLFCLTQRVLLLEHSYFLKLTGIMITYIRRKNAIKEQLHTTHLFLSPFVTSSSLSLVSSVPNFFSSCKNLVSDLKRKKHASSCIILILSTSQINHYIITTATLSS